MFSNQLPLLAFKSFSNSNYLFFRIHFKAEIVFEIVGLPFSNAN